MLGEIRNPKVTVKNKKKLLKHVSAVVDLLIEDEDFSKKDIKVVYNLDDLEAKVYIPPIIDRIKNTGNCSIYYNWSFVDKLVELSDKETISYNIGYTNNNFDLHVQIFI